MGYSEYHIHSIIKLNVFQFHENQADVFDIKQLESSNNVTKASFPKPVNISVDRTMYFRMLKVAAVR